MVGKVASSLVALGRVKREMDHEGGLWESGGGWGVGGGGGGGGGRGGGGGGGGGEGRGEESRRSINIRIGSG